MNGVRAKPVLVVGAFAWPSPVRPARSVVAIRRTKNTHGNVLNANERLAVATLLQLAGTSRPDDDSFTPVAAHGIGISIREERKVESQDARARETLSGETESFEMNRSSCRTLVIDSGTPSTVDSRGR